MMQFNQYGALGMRQSDLFATTTKDAAADEDSINAKLLLKAGFVRKLSAGVYSYLPLGLRTLSKIEQIVREEMGRVRSQEVLMPALQPRDPWDQTDRWNDMDEVMFKFKGAGDRDLCLGATHEEIITPLVGNFVNSYRDLPVSVFQIQTKYRNEKRAKSGVLRGREFRMKDMYSFHKTVEDLDDYYDEATQAYWNVLERCGLKEISYFTYASGGAFSKYSHEFQTVTEAGEDIIHICQDCGTAVNVEIMDDLNHTCPKCGGKHFEQTKAIETANIFKLMTRFSSAFKLGYQDEQGQHQDQIYMGCYGIGTSRLIGAVVEACHDESGMIWPTQIAPYQVHLVSLVQDANDIQKVDAIYETLLKSGIEVLYDDREKVRAGAKFSDSDLIGLPYRVTVGKKALENNVIEVKNRKSGDVSEISLSDFIARF